ncbi:MAG: sugar ABC transporter permease YjfF, partial [Oscillospiraceae bacterium]|nr:sugar ABC transporter permease YjfF [Oscillospiraceae bacterium]
MQNFFKGGNPLKRMTDTNLLTTITITVFLVMYLASILFLGEGFRKPQQMLNLISTNAYLIILSCGMSLVMITGGIDISVGGVTALVAMCCAVYLDEHGGNVVVAMMIAVAIGLAFGLVQGYLIGYLDIQPFI